jgi:hypothetical protein
MTEIMSPEAARRVARHLLGGVEAASAAPWQDAPAVLLKYVRAFADQLARGDVSWVDQPVPAGTANPFDPRPQGEVDVWTEVDELRDRVARLLVREERTSTGAVRKVGYFAIRHMHATKFYRVTRPLDGKWAGRVFVDAQASDDYHAVRSPAGLRVALAGILADPAGAALLYAGELGRCSRCARTLTDEESRAAGMGPDCRAIAS